MRYALYCLFFLLLATPGNAQVTGAFKAGKEEAIHDILERIAEEYELEVDLLDVQTELEHYYDEPLNLNAATYEELAGLYILSEAQIKSLREHIKEFGPLISIYELQAVEGFDINTIERLLPFITVNSNTGASNITIKQALKQGTNDLILRSAETLERAKGYSLPAGDKNRFLGSPYQLYTRYDHHFGSKLSLGFTAKKDAGEEFFRGSQKQGFDFYSAHFYYSGGKRMKSLAIGDYSIQFGQGLCAGSGLLFSKSPEVLNIARPAQGIRPYRSTNEAQYLRGFAITYGLGNFDITAFGSHKYIDATVHPADSLAQTEFYFSALQLAGLHRNLPELANRHTISEDMCGGELKYTYKGLKLGATGIYGSYSIPLQKVLKPYNQFDFNGRDFLNTGINYSWLFRNAYFFGETSGSRNGAIATINGFLINLGPMLDFGAIYRNYPRSYQALYSNAFREGSGDNNERGSYLALTFRPAREWRLGAYFDKFEFPWLRYRVDAPSGGYDYLADLDYKPGKKLDIYARYRSHVKEVDAPAGTENLHLLLHTNKQSLRFQLTYHVNDVLMFRTRMEVSRFTEETMRPENGFVAFQDLEYKPLNKKLGISLRYSLFDISGYNARIATFEKDVPSSFSIPFLQNDGTRYYVLLQYRITRGATAIFRFARTAYFNKDAISSGINQIQGNLHTEVKAQLDFRF
jgi:hypothetical protein